MAREYDAKLNGKDLDLQEIKRAKEQSAVHDIRRKSITVDISLRTILLVLAIGAFIYFGSKLFDVVVLLFLAVIISSAAIPSVRWLQKRGIPKGLAIAMVYLFGLVALTLLLLLVVVPVISETQKLVSDIPGYFKDVEKGIKGFSFYGIDVSSSLVRYYFDQFMNWLTENATAQGGVDGVKAAFDAVINVAGGIVSVVTAFLMSIYIVYDHDNFVDLLLLRIFDEKKRTRVRQLLLDVQEKLGGWLLGQANLSLIIGGITWILLVLLKVPFALPLAVLAGLMESIPSLGPMLSSIPAILVALFATGSPVTALFVALGFIVIQQLENSFIVPKVMSNAVGLKPIFVIISVVSGFTLGGPIGALLSIPVAVLIQIGYEFYLDLQKIEAEGIV